MNDITPKEAIEILRHNTDLGYGIVIEGEDTSKIKQALSLASKALEIVDDVNHKIYRNENCPRKHLCYDYQGYHCSGCSWEMKGRFAK